MSIKGAAPAMASQKKIAHYLDSVKEGATARMNDESGPYPFVAYAPDPRDNRWEELQHQIRSGVVPHYDLQEGDLDYIMTQKKQQEQLQFDIWAWNTFDQRNPAIRQWYRERIDPNMYERMVAYLNASLENTKKWSKINMMGPDNMEDMKFIYALQQGKIHVPLSFDPMQMQNPLPMATRGRNRFDPKALGVFNPIGWVNKLSGKATGYNQDNQMNISSAPTIGTRTGINIPGFAPAPNVGAGFLRDDREL